MKKEANFCDGLSSNTVEIVGNDILFYSDTDIAGFQLEFDLPENEIINDAFGGHAEINNFLVTANKNKVLGYSLSNKIIPAGCGILLTLSSNVQINKLSDVILSDNRNNRIDVSYSSTLECLSNPSSVSVIDDTGNKYLFNGDSSYDSAKKFGLQNGKYTLSGIPYQHPFAILNSGIEGNISYGLPANVNDTAIEILVSGGNSTVNSGSDYFTFKIGSNEINIGNGGYTFMRGRKYLFKIESDLLSNHEFKIFANGILSNSIKNENDEIEIIIADNHSVVVGDLYYQCPLHPDSMKVDLTLSYKEVNISGEVVANYDFYHGDIEVTVSSNFTSVSVYCYIHGYMGVSKLFEYDNSCTGAIYVFASKAELETAVTAWLTNSTNAAVIYGDISTWDVSQITDMSSLFKNGQNGNNTTSFNADLSLWDVSNVVTMKEMFKSALAFDSDISGWDVSNVQNMESMFSSTSNFNADISSWEVGQVISMKQMFDNSSAFDIDISLWDVSNVINMEKMFNSAAIFNQPNIAIWDVSSVSNFTSIFKNSGMVNLTGNDANSNDSTTVDGSWFTGPLGAGVSGDPHVLTFGGNKCELPHTAEIYNFLNTNNMTINANTYMIKNQAYIENIYINYKGSSISMNISTLQILDLNNYDLTFKIKELGLLTKQISTFDKKYIITVNSEKNAFMLNSKFNLNQENSSGILMSDDFDECIIDNLNYVK